MIKTTPIRRLYRASSCFFIALILLAYYERRCFASSDGDFQFWNTISVSFDVNKDWSAAVEEQLKFDNDAGHFYQHQTDLEFTYKNLPDWIEIGLNYKQVFKEESDDHWSRENRPHFNITVKGRWVSLDFSDRSRFEYRDKEYGDDLWRYTNKLEVNLPFELTQYRLHPYIADQVYINMDGSGFEKNRVYTGVTFKMSEDLESEIYYVRQWSESFGRWRELDALGFDLKFRF